MKSSRGLSAVVLAVGPEKSMRSERPKPLHMLCGRPMGSYVLEALSQTQIGQCVVVANSEAIRIGKRLKEEPLGFSLRVVEQTSFTNHGDALVLGVNDLDELHEEEDVVVLSADLPLLNPETIKNLLEQHYSTDAACTLLTSFCSDISELESLAHVNVVVRDKNQKISELVDQATAESLGFLSEGPFEVSFGIYCLKRDYISASIRRIDTAAGQTQIRDIVKVLAESGHLCASVEIGDGSVLTPVDDRVQLAVSEAKLRSRINNYWLNAGVTMVDPERTYIDSTVVLGKDVTLFPGTFLKGKTNIGNGCRIGPDAKLDSCTLGQNTQVEFSVIEGSMIGSDCRVGPYSVLKAGSELADGTFTGPFFGQDQ